MRRGIYACAFFFVCVWQAWTDQQRKRATHPSALQLATAQPQPDAPLRPANAPGRGPAASRATAPLSLGAGRSWQAHASAFVGRRVAACGRLMRTAAVATRVLATRNGAARALEQAGTREGWQGTPPLRLFGYPWLCPPCFGFGA